MKSCELSVSKAVNGYTMHLSYKKDDGEWVDEVYLASTAAKLKKMVINAIKMIDADKEEPNAN